VEERQGQDAGWGKDVTAEVLRRQMEHTNKKVLFQKGNKQLSGGGKGSPQAKKGGGRITASNGV